jgi:hypothetical protein
VGAMNPKIRRARFTLSGHFTFFTPQNLYARVLREREFTPYNPRAN